MIVVTKVEVKRFAEDREVEIMYLNKLRTNCSLIGGSVDTITIKENIEGRIFMNVNQDKLCIGMSKQAQIALGLPFEVFDNQIRRIESLLNSGKKKSTKISYLNFQLTKLRKLEKFPILFKVVSFLQRFMSR